MQFNGLKLICALGEFSIKNEENKGFECSSLRIEVKMISSRLEKHQTSKFLLIKFKGHLNGLCQRYFRFLK